MTLRATDLPPKPAPELTDGVGKRWTLRITNTGGVGNGRALALVASGLGTLEAPAFGVQGDRVLLHHEVCQAGDTPRFYENEYRWRVTGRQLTFTKVTNRCSDQVTATLLTARPWTRQD
ncbi:MAG: hypothetical protein M3155_02405 [Actinomycetota bacterium]|nr:hypothetical protein [Actinomycetota bacterium]